MEVRGDSEKVIFQEPFLVVSPERLHLEAAELQSPVAIPLQVENPGVVARTGVSLLAAGVQVPVGSIEPRSAGRGVCSIFPIACWPRRSGSPWTSGS